MDQTQAQDGATQAQDAGAHHAHIAHAGHAYHAQHQKGQNAAERIYRSKYFKPFLIYLAISIVMFWQVAINLMGYVVNGHGDVYQSLFFLWWVPYTVFVLHQTPYFTNLFFYPIGANLATQTITPIAGILTAPIQWISPALAYNLLFFSSFALSGLFMFALSDYFLKNKYASFIAGLIYAFSPMHIAQSYWHLNWTIIEWVPLFLLFYFRTINEQKLKYAALAAASFVLLTFMGDIEQGIMVLFAAVVLTVLYVMLDRNKVLNRKSLINIGCFAIITLIIASPFIIAIAPYLSGQTFSLAQQNSGAASSMTWSDNLLSFFLPGYYNGIFNGLASSYVQQVYSLTYKGVDYGTNLSERTSYLGYTALALVLAALYFDYKKNRLRHSALWLGLGAIAAWLSLGPYLQVGSVTTGIPTLYSVYRLIPILNIIREPGRFDLILMLCVAMLAALGFDYLTKDRESKKAFYLLIVVSLLILIEYNGMPLSGSMANSTITSAQIPLAYSQIGKLQGNFSVLVLPILPNGTSQPAQYLGMSMYYATAMKRPIIGGYTSRESANQSISVSSIPLVQAASFLESGDGLIYPSPIHENYSNLTLLWLANYNTALVSVIRQAYPQQSQEQLYGYLYSVFGQPVYSDNSTFVFSTQQAVLSKAGKSLTAYQTGNWTPGYEFCGPYGQCNQTLADMWWGSNPRSIVVFSPNEMSIAMSLEAVAPNSTSLAIYLDSTPVTAISVGQEPSMYHLNLTVPQGFSEIVFYSQADGMSAPSYFDYGIENITLSKK